VIEKTRLKIKFISNCAYHEEVDIMKKIVVTVIVLLISIAFVSTCFARSKTPPKHVTQKKMVSEKTTKQGKAPTPKKHIAKAKVSGFVGQVTIVDGNLIQVKGGEEEVTFDASSPVLKGYTSISDVMVGDTVAADYTKDGLMITKLKEAAGEKKVEKAKRLDKEETVRLYTCKGLSPCTVSVYKAIE
jgi:hypothetical protein